MTLSIRVDSVLRKVPTAVTKICPTCNTSFVVKRSHAGIKTYCSKRCMADGYATRMRGENNPNFRNASSKACSACGVEYHSYNAASKYCSQACYRPQRPPTESKPKRTVRQCEICGNAPPHKKGARHCGGDICASAVRALNKRLLKPSVAAKVCIQCGGSYKSYNKTRRFCSYACHLASGGAFRAGIAASMATRTYGAKKDANHNEIFAKLRERCAVYDLSGVGAGVPDGIAWIQEAWHLFDVKNPKTGYGRRGLNKVQKKWISQWPGGPVYLIYTTEEAEQFAAGNFSQIKREKSAAS